MTSCEILYGPLNCAFVLTGENWCAPATFTDSATPAPFPSVCELCFVF